MNASETAAIQRLDYQAPDYLIPKTELSFRLDPTQTEVRSRLEITRAEGVSEAAPLVLNGAELDLKSVRVNGESVGADSMEKTDSHLSLFNLPDAFTLEIVTEISPDTNTALEGLYRSSGNYCTQCEAEGFRKITYFLDRPDVLSVYTVAIIGDKASLPVLLSNGDPISNRALPTPQAKLSVCIGSRGFGCGRRFIHHPKWTGGLVTDLRSGSQPNTV